MNLGERIKQTRNKKGLTQEELSQKANISRVSIGNYERGDRTPPSNILIKIANALEISITELLDNNEDELIKVGKGSTGETRDILLNEYHVLKHRKQEKDYLKLLEDFYMMQYQLTHLGFAPVDGITDKIFNTGLENFKSALPYKDLSKLTEMLNFLLKLDEQLNNDAPFKLTMDDIKTFLNELKKHK